MIRRLDLSDFVSLTEFIQHKEGHKNSKGESAPWIIVSHTGKILSSHKTKAEAVKHLRAIEYFKHQ